MYISIYTYIYFLISVVMQYFCFYFVLLLFTVFYSLQLQGQGSMNPRDENCIYIGQRSMNPRDEDCLYNTIYRTRVYESQR